MPLERAEKRESTAIEVTCNTINDELIEPFLIEFWPNKRGGNDNSYCLRLFNKLLTLQDLKANSTKQITKPLVGWS